LEFYPEQIQSLISQFYGWQAPGTNYCVEMINKGMEKEENIVRYLLTKLIKFKGNHDEKIAV